MSESRAAALDHHCLSYLEGGCWTSGYTCILLGLVATEGLETACASGFRRQGISSCHLSWLPFVGDCCCQTWLKRVFLSFLANIWKATDFFLALWITLLMLKSTLMKLFPFPQEIFCVNVFLSFPYWFYLQCLLPSLVFRALHLSS